MKKTVIRCLLAGAAMMATLAAGAQTIYLDPNFKRAERELHGLLSPQDPSTLPVSKTPPQTTTRKAYVPTKTVLKDLGNREYSVTGGWEMLDAQSALASGDFIRGRHDASKWFNATVPGTILTTLVDQGLYPDPYYGLI